MLYKILWLSAINQQESAIGTPMSPPSQTFLLSPSHSTLQAVITSLFEFPESYDKFPLAIHFTYGILNFYVTLSMISPSPSSPTPCPEVCSLCLFLHCCPENKFINAIFLDSIYISIQYLHLFLSYFCLCNRL